MSFVKLNQPCPSCGGSDPVAINDNGSAKCFSCGTFFKDYSEASGGNVSDFSTYQRNNNNNNSTEASFNALTDRGISIETAKKYGVKSVLSSDGSIYEHHYPMYINNEVVATKIRRPNKEFYWRGSSKGTSLFGQQLCQEGGKYITLTEGECDAMASYQLMGSQWPVVSVKNGAEGAVRDVKDNLEFLESYDTVVINFDNDKVGREAAKKVARLLKPAKAKILQLPEQFKDANEMLKLGQHKAYVSAWWASKIYTPSGVLNVSEERANYKKREKKESVPYPWNGLNAKLEGLRQGELVTLTGGTGLGKSSITREIEHWLISKTNDNVGIIALEEDWRRTIDGILSIEANAKLHIDSVRNGYTEKELDSFYDIMYDGDNKNRVWIHAHFGMNDLDSIFSKLRFMIVGCGCKWVVVDHLHMLVSCSVEGNRGHENGIATGLSHLRGSQSIAQLSDCVLSLERNQQSEDPIESSTTKVRILKSRYTGDVGLATSLYYNYDTGRLTEVEINVRDELQVEL